MSWKDSCGNRRGEDEEYDEKEIEKESLRHQKNIDEKLSKGSVLDNFCARRAYYEELNRNK